MSACLPTAARKRTSWHFPSGPTCGFARRGRFCQTTDDSSVFVPYHRGMAGVESYDVDAGKSRLGHPVTALAERKLEPLLSFKKHRETPEKRLSVHPVIIDHGLVDHHRTTFRKSPTGLLQKHSLCRQAPVMEDAAHDENFGARQLVLKEIPRVKRQSPIQTPGINVLAKRLLDFGKIESPAREVRMNFGDLRGHAALSCADVDESRIFVPAEQARERLCRQSAARRHRAQKLSKRSGVGVKGVISSIAQRTALWQPRAQRGGEPPPDRVHPRVEMIDEITDVVRALAA